MIIKTYFCDEVLTLKVGWPKLLTCKNEKETSVLDITYWLIVVMTTISSVRK